MLTYRERKKRLLWGAMTRVAEQFGVALSTVARVNRGVVRWPEIEAALASMMEPVTSAVEAYGPPPRVVHRGLRRGAREAQSA